VRGIVVIGLVFATPARAEHHHHHHHVPSILEEHRHGYGASLGVVLANYDAPLFSGDYQGSTVGGWWMGQRFGVGVSVPAYHLTKNGIAVSGLGDVMLHGHAMLLTRGAWMVDAMLMASVPTGDGRQGLCMGDVMVMPDLGARLTLSKLSVGVRLGAGYMNGGAGAHAEHGQKMWPLIDPMNGSELTFAVRGMVELAPSLAAGLQVRSAAPIGNGDNRVIGGLRTVWLAGRVETSFTVEHSFVGYAFVVRGLLETAVRFD
jgi:hypothetical protein